MATIDNAPVLSDSDSEPGDAIDTSQITLGTITRRAKEMRTYLKTAADVWKSVDKKLTTWDAVSAMIPKCCRDDEVLFRFALVRNFDYESASRRYLRFCSSVAEIGIESLTKVPPAALPVVSGGPWHVLTETDAQGRPVMNVYARYIDWSKYDIPAMKAAMVYYSWKVCTTNGYAAQQQGTVFGMFMQGMSMSMIKPEFEHFAMSMMSQTLPMRVSVMFAVDSTFAVRNIIYPMLCLGLKAKMRKRIVWVTSSPDPKRGKPAYAELHEHLPVHIIPAEQGGHLAFDPAQESEAVMSTA